MRTPRSAPHAQHARWWYLLLLLPVIATLWLPWFNRSTPALAGIPFFYWYLLAWVPLSALCSAWVYLRTRHLH
ncbi:MAG: DUF3311 domain-containing protein [Metallibacterium scheffleri]|jgi:hypothetical protein|uniref:DUF3311 domain-containing protein n=1 Tax=Metallibacterium scheffleri TaxID=993689 RepID=UPI0023A56911|nr:DUF3311 domain-containing protein [Metallibacterium scheffleri]MBU6404165.1 DUF3311 domain-containing protein [Pseudomonadota bacterium]MCK9366204.1 DUF3311 domain-containing protein [Metallibacterium scheffleri]MDE3142033.1 DUF3311 domain-containing protein [Pseudomonadota bacterium]